MTNHRKEANTSITMVREDFEHVPDYQLPPGYRFRTYRDGDVETWTTLHLAAEPFVDITDELFEREFGDGWDVLPERMLFVETTEEEPVGTITAWWEKERDRPNERGRIHWVVVHPDHQGQGIAKAMMSKAMSLLSQYHSRAMLGTSSGREVAIKIYLDFGFWPDIDELEDSDVYSAWVCLDDQLQRPSLAKFLTSHENRTG